jgi:UDP-glucose 4-epimerase
MKLVVTGGAGFIGSHVVARMVREPLVDEVVVLDDLSTGRHENLTGVVGPRLVVGSITDADLVMDTLRGASVVVHLAARPSVPRSTADPLTAHTVNATGTVTILEAARALDVDHVIVASSSSVYGSNPKLPKHEELATRPLSPYAASKLATEAYALAYAETFRIPTLVFRFFNVFGPRQPATHAYAAVIPAFVSAALDGAPLRVFGDGHQSRDFTYVESVAAAIHEAVIRKVTCSSPMNLALGSRRSLLDVVETLQRILSATLTIDHLPPRPGDVRHSQADTSLFAEHFPEIAPIDFETALRRTVEWFVDMTKANATADPAP